jgi:hypothetical protein
MSLHKIYQKLRLVVKNTNLLSPEEMAITVDTVKEHAAKKGMTFNCPVLVGTDKDLSELETFLLTLEKNKDNYPNNTQFQYLFNYTVDSSMSNLMPHWTSANVHIVDGQIKFYLLDAANLIDGFIVQFALINKYCPGAEITATHLKIQKDYENCGYFSLDHAIGLARIPDLPKKLDPLCGCDVFLMKNTTDNYLILDKNNYLISDKNHLYLYQDKKNGVLLYRYQNPVNGQIEDFSIQVPASLHLTSLDELDSDFIQTENAPKRCEYMNFCNAVLEISSKRNHTLDHSNSETQDYYKNLSRQPVYHNLSREEQAHLKTGLKKLKYIPGNVLLRQPGFGSLFKNTQSHSSEELKDVTTRKGKSLNQFIQGHQREHKGKPDDEGEVSITMRNFAITDKASKTKKRALTHLGSVIGDQFETIIANRQGNVFLSDLAKPGVPAENKAMEVKDQVDVSHDASSVSIHFKAASDDNPDEPSLRQPVAPDFDAKWKVAMTSLDEAIKESHSAQDIDRFLRDLLAKEEESGNPNFMQDFESFLNAKNKSGETFAEKIAKNIKTVDNLYALQVLFVYGADITNCLKVIDKNSPQAEPAEYLIKRMLDISQIKDICLMKTQNTYSLLSSFNKQDPLPDGLRASTISMLKDRNSLHDLISPNSERLKIFLGKNSDTLKALVEASNKIR